MSQILVAYDGSPGASCALDHAARLAGHGDRVDVVGVVALGRGAGAVGPEAIELRGAQLDEAVARLGASGVQARAVLRIGDPATAICQLAEEGGHDVIVVGGRDVAGDDRPGLGSVSDRVAHRAPCDVLVARQARRGSAALAHC